VIFITGASGFVGQHLATLCAQHGEEVFGPSRDELELLDADAVRKAIARVRPDHVFHLAADASVAQSWDEPGSVIDNNVRSTLNLLEALRSEAPEASLLVACSGEEYGRPVDLPMSEDHPLRPQNPYATSKSMTDLLAGFYADGHGMRVVRTRAFNHAGPGQSDTYVVSSFARQIAEAEASDRRDGRVVVATGNAEARRDFSDVRDVVRAYWMLGVEHDEAGVFNVCSGQAIAVSDILTGLAAHSPLEVERRTDPSRLRDNEVMEIRGSHDKLTAATGWRPEIDFSDTLRDTLDWWRERVSAGVTG
jgi:GDP-4-dehydro-6-deoxy-D-mannose reductase